MFVLPPPTRALANGQGAAYYAMGGAPLIETNNTLEHPAGDEHQLVLGEGIYALKDDLHLATPPPHPSEAPMPNNNPLATTIGPPMAGVKLSIAVLAPRKPPSHILGRLATGSSLSSIPPSIEEETQSPKSEAGSTVNGFGTASYYNQTPSFGDGNLALAPAVPAKNKKEQKLKPKSNILKSNSSFVSRVIPHDSLQKRLNERSPEGVFAFANINRAFLWLDLSSETKAEQLTKVLFTKANVLCHDVNALTKSNNHMDVIMGFSTGDIIWYEPFSQKYARLNKNESINSSAVSSISWLPNKENLFLAAHMDGTLMVYDKEKEDGEVLPEEQVLDEGPSKLKLRIKKSVHSKNQKGNPVSSWKVSNAKVNDMSFSPDGQLLATVSEDGSLTIIDFVNERVQQIHRGYFGALLCVTWSPDGRYVLTGGGDDLVSIWSVADQILVARCEGHDNWVTDVKFDPWRCDERNYRFGSVGDDCKLLLWDFSVGMLGRPKAARRQSAASRLGSFSMSSAGDADAEGEEHLTYEVGSKASTPTLPPVMSKQIGQQPLCWLGFEEHGIMASSQDGHIREWSRPTQGS